MLKVILFDLDETLYPRASSLMNVIGKRIEHYVTDVIGVDPEQAEELRRRWRRTYGTALRGMMEEGWAVDVDDYLRYVHDVPLEGYIKPQPEVRAMLLNLPLRRAVLTNSNIEHAGRVLEHINLFDCFERVIDLRTLNFLNKPDPKAYQVALNLMGVQADEVLFVEDTPINTRPAKALGIHTILVDCPPTDDADYCVPTVMHVADIVANLLKVS
jgi:putative hydrolase of the HAD superfamily